MNKCRGMLWKQRGLQNRVTCSCKIRGSRSHCIDLHNRACISAGSEIGLCWNHSPIYHTGGPPIAQRDGECSNKACNVVMVKIWVRRLDCLRLDLTTAGVLGLQSRLSYCEICAATCFRLRGDNLNENPPFDHAYGWPKAGAQTQEVQLDSEVSDLEQDSPESEASLVSIKGKYLLGHRQWERVREKTIKA